MSIHETHEFFEELKTRLTMRKRSSIPIQTLRAFPLAKDQALYVLDFKSKSVTFQKGISEMLGYDEKEFNFEKVTSYYHPSDYDMISRLLRATIAYASENPVKAADVALFVTGRIQHKNGNYIKTLRQSTIFERDENNRMLSNISIISDISFMDTSTKVNWKFIAEGLIEEAFRIYVMKEYSDFFSRREVEVLNLLSQGLTSAAVSQKLHISKHTVDGHRRKMLEKSHSSNTVELINFAKTNGIL